MQTVLVLPPVQMPAPHIGPEVPFSPEGAFEASFEAEPRVAEGPVGPPVMLAMPASPVIAVGSTIAVENPETGIAGEAVAAMTAATVPTVAKVTDTVGPTFPGQRADAESEKGGRPPIRPIAERKPDNGHGEMSQGARPATAGDAVQDAGPLDAGLATRPNVAAAAWTATRPTCDADGQAVMSLPDVVRTEVPDRAESPGQTAVGQTQQARTAFPEALGLATGPLRQGANPEATRAFPLSREVGPQASPPGSDLQKEAPQSAAATVVSGPVAASFAIPGTQTAVAGGEEDGGGSPDVPFSTNGEAGNPALAEGEYQPKERRTGPGLWESMFTSLSLPLSAVGEVARALRPVLAARMDTVAQLSQVGDEAVLATHDMSASDPRVSEADLTAATPPASEMPKTAAPALGPAVALWPQTTIWMMPTDKRDHSTGDEGFQTLVAPGTMATAGGTSGPSAIPAMPSSPVPHVAAQMTAALSQSSDGATELALSPDELGHVRLRMEPDAANPDRMVVMITFERPETLDLFRRHAGELAEALRAAGYAGADIGFGQDHSGSSGSEGSSGRSPGWGMGPDQSDPSPVLSPAPRLAAGASLDLRL